MPPGGGTAKHWAGDITGSLSAATNPGTTGAKSAVGREGEHTNASSVIEIVTIVNLFEIVTILNQSAEPPRLRVEPPPFF